ncbi:MAG: pseudouridine synthase [Cytophagales bacterium]|nr:pseudouridine synthase [Cytophagales bacterium]
MNSGLSSRSSANISSRGEENTLGLRINRFLASSGLGSRRRVEESIRRGEVTVDGKVLSDLSFRVQPGVKVKYRGRLIKPRPHLSLMLNKPNNCICSRNDPQKRFTVMDCLEKKYQHLYPIGRLDRNTTGLLLLSNEGALAQRLSHPSYEIEKIYQVQLDQPIREPDIKRLCSGIMDKGENLVFDRVKPLSSGVEVEISLHSGKNRVIRRALEALNYKILSLHRISYGNLILSNLARGKYRPLTSQELRKLRHLISSQK